MSTRFADHTRELLRNRPITLTLEKISNGCPQGPDGKPCVTVPWLKQFASDGKGSANRIEMLYVYLTGESPKLLPINPKFYAG
jgi:hypothetical protein